MNINAGLQSGLCGYTTDHTTNVRTQHNMVLVLINKSVNKQMPGRKVQMNQHWRHSQMTGLLKYVSDKVSATKSNSVMQEGIDRINSNTMRELITTQTDLLMQTRNRVCATK